MTQISLLRTAGRAGLAATAAAFLAFGLAAPAAAEPAEGPTKASYNNQATRGLKVDMEGDSGAHTTLFQLDLASGGYLETYCIDLKTPIPHDFPVPYVEGQWSEYPGAGEFKAEAGKVLWVLQNSYPSTDLTALASDAGVEKVTEEQAIAATQAAIWHFSNGSDLLGVPSEKDAETVTAVYEYLVGAATPISEPTPALSITPGTVEGVAGEIVGEFTIETNSETAIPVVESPENPDGVDLVDMDGNPVTEVENGDKVGFEVPAGTEAGQASFSLKTSTMAPAGRLFKGDEGVTTQTLITAEDKEITAEASASATWTVGGEEPTPTPTPTEEPSEPASPSPSPSESPSTPASPKPTPGDDQNGPTLPVTGGALAGLVAAGIAALGAGGGAIYLSRKRKAAGTSTEG